MVRRLDARATGFEAQFEALLSTQRETQEDVAGVVRAIIADVRKRGDEALCEYSAQFDRVTLSAATMRVGADELDAAEAKCSKAALDALDVAAKRIEVYHRRQLPRDISFTDDTGTT